MSQAIASPSHKGSSYPLGSGPAAARSGAVVATYRVLMVRLGEWLELLGAGMQDRYLVEKRPESYGQTSFQD